MSKGSRDWMQFPFRWFDALLGLPDSTMRKYLEAMRDYGRDGIKPSFSNPLEAALWREFAVVIEFYRKKYDIVCDRNRRNGDGGGRPPKNLKEPEKPSGFSKNPKEPKKPSGFSENPVGANQETRNQETRKTEGEKEYLNFRRWTEAQFKQSVSDVVSEHSKYADIEKAFTDYWTEPDPKGKPRFQLEKTWDTARRLARWYDNNTTIKSESSPKGAGEGEWMV